MNKPFNIHDVKPGETFPVKVQVSLNAGSDSTMVYSKDNVPISFRDKEIPRSFGENLLGNDLKGYFNAHFTEEDKLSIDCRITDQPW
jgi:hypothetical protein